MKKLCIDLLQEGNLGFIKAVTSYGVKINL